MPPTIPQMRARSETGHIAILRAVREGRPYVTAATPLSALRGFRTARSTLVRWGCLEVVTGDRDDRGRPTYHDRITERGEALLVAVTMAAALRMIATHPEAEMEGSGVEMQTIAREALVRANAT